MFKFISLTAHDPILLVTTLVLIAALVILAWSLREYFGLTKRKPMEPRRHTRDMENPEPAEPEPPARQENENFILMEAHLREMSTQLAEIGRRLANLEKTVSQKKAADQTIPAMFNNAEMEKFIQRIESRLELLSSDKPQGAQGAPDAVAKLEAKIEGIHKLLILLTDGGGTGIK